MPTDVSGFEERKAVAPDLPAPGIDTQKQTLRQRDVNTDLAVYVSEILLHVPPRRVQGGFRAHLASGIERVLVEAGVATALYLHSNLTIGTETYRALLAENRVRIGTRGVGIFQNGAGEESSFDPAAERHRRKERELVEGDPVNLVGLVVGRLVSETVVAQLVETRDAGLEG